MVSPQFPISNVPWKNKGNSKVIEDENRGLCDSLTCYTRKRVFAYPSDSRSTEDLHCASDIPTLILFGRCCPATFTILHYYDCVILVVYCGFYDEVWNSKFHAYRAGQLLKCQPLAPRDVATTNLAARFGDDFCRSNNHHSFRFH